MKNITGRSKSTLEKLLNGNEAHSTRNNEKECQAVILVDST